MKKRTKPPKPKMPKTPLEVIANELKILNKMVAISIMALEKKWQEERMEKEKSKEQSDKTIKKMIQMMTGKVDLADVLGIKELPEKTETQKTENDKTNE